MNETFRRWLPVALLWLAILIYLYAESPMVEIGRRAVAEGVIR